MHSIQNLFVSSFLRKSISFSSSCASLFPNSIDIVWENLPKKVEIVEVGPRDGLQNERRILPAKIKYELIERLSECGYSVIEATSFVAPHAVPQMADASQVFQSVRETLIEPKKAPLRYPVLTPNMRGFQNALAQGAQEIAVFGASSNSFSKANINCTVEESIDIYRDVVQAAKENNIRVRGYVSTALGCPYEGQVPVATVCDVVEKFYGFGCDEIALGDTIGVGTAQSTRDLLLAVKKILPIEKIAVHFHDTYGMALSNILTSLQHGIHIIDSSVAGLGGCPYAPAATGNVATEDVLYLLEGLGIETGIDLEKVIEIGDWISDYLGKHSRSKVALAKSRFHSD